MNDQRAIFFSPFFFGSLLALLVACNRSDAPAAEAPATPVEAPTASVAATSPASPATEAAAAPAPAEVSAPVDAPSLVALSAGAFPVVRLSEYSVAYSTTQLVDDRTNTVWTSTEGKLGPDVAVFALPERTVLTSVAFDCGGTTTSCAQEVSVEVSDTDEKSGWTPVLEATLKAGEDGQRFAIATEVPGRWVRLTLKNNHGSTRFIELAEFRAYGGQLTQTPFPDVSGTYESSLGEMHLKQEGTLVSGCYYTRGGVFEGGIEGRVIKLTWCDRCNTPQEQRGPAVLDFAPDAQQFLGIYWDEGQVSGHGAGWDGTKKSSDVGSCPQWADAPADVGPAQQQMTKDLETLGRVRVYGINFDSDSDRIKDESKPALDNIVRVLLANAQWNLSIEGHTDSTSTPAHNQDLSERRAVAVKAYLTGAGIDATRLSTVGLGQDKPVAPNETPTGRAQNRRVELVRQ